MKKELKVQLEAYLENQSLAMSIAAAYVSEVDPTVEEMTEVKTAVSEAVTNSIVHGYEDNVGIIDIKCKIHNNEVIIVISDNGKGIENIEMAKQPLYTTKPNLERSGMGFTIMESFMDELNIESILGLGTKVTMKKKIGYDIDEKNNIDNLVTLEEALRGE